jgi:Putative DNA-binding domain
VSAIAGTNFGSLGDLQRAFQDYLLAHSESFAAAVRDTRKADRITLLDVYRDGYALRLIEALTTDYPGLMAMAGPADFDHMARAYIVAHPSRHPSIRWFGRGLADFLASTPPYDKSQAAAEMARFEWTLGEAFDSADAAPVAADAVMALPPHAWEMLSFAVLPSLRRLALAFEVPQAWQRREEVEAGNLDVAPAAQSVPWVIWRPERVSHFRSLDVDEAAMLDALADGRSFPELCETLLAHVGEQEAPARAAGLLRSWVEEGMIASFSA